jgi:hypothetical protein
MADGNFPGVLPGRGLLAFGDGAAGASTEDQKKRVPGGAPPPRGIFADFGGATPKYARNQGGRESDFRETMARMFVQVGKDEYQKFINSVPPESQKLAQVIAGTNTVAGDGNGGAGYIDFLLQSAAHGLTEKADIIETLADDYTAYFFGQAAPTFQYGGTLINSVQDDQVVNMYRLYRDMLRGTQLARRRKLVRLKYDSFIVSGAMMNLTWNLGAENELACQFSFNLLVKSIIILPNEEYGLVRLSTMFASASELPSVTTGVKSTGVVPVRLTAVPAAKSEFTGVQATLDNNASPPPPPPAAPAEVVAPPVQNLTPFLSNRNR